jgi:hypothetical protein
MFVCRAVNHYKELWKFEDKARSGRVRSVRAEATIKTVRERIRRSPLQKQKIKARELNILARSMSLLIRDDLHNESILVVEGTPPYSCFEGNLTDKIRASSPVARREWAQKHPLHHLGAVQPPE